MKEPLDGGCDKAMAQQGLLDRIKEEPDDAHEYGPQESELKISAVFSAGDTSLGFQVGLPSSGRVHHFLQFQLLKCFVLVVKNCFLRDNLPTGRPDLPSFTAPWDASSDSPPQSACHLFPREPVHIAPKTF